MYDTNVSEKVLMMKKKLWFLLHGPWLIEVVFPLHRHHRIFNRVFNRLFNWLFNRIFKLNVLLCQETKRKTAFLSFQLPHNNKKKIFWTNISNHILQFFFRNSLNKTNLLFFRCWKIITTHSLLRQYIFWKLYHNDRCWFQNSYGCREWTTR